MDLTRLRADAEQAFGADGTIYAVTLAQSPAFKPRPAQDEPESVERDGSGLVAERVPALEAGVAAIESAGWELASIAVGEGKVVVMSTSIPYPKVTAVFSRPRRPE